MSYTCVVSLQCHVRRFLAKHYMKERKVAIANTAAKSSNSPLIGMIVVYNFDNKMGILIYKEIDERNNVKVNFVMFLKSCLPPKYIPHRDTVTFNLVQNKKKKDKQLAEIISVLKRSKYSYRNLTKETYHGEVVKSKNEEHFINFKYHQMSYRTTPNTEYIHEIEDCKVIFKLNNTFKAHKICVQ